MQRSERTRYSPEPRSLGRGTGRLSRRTLLRAAGAGIALPFLDAMLPAFGRAARAAATATPRRMVAIHIPLGMMPRYFFPGKLEEPAAPAQLAPAPAAGPPRCRRPHHFPAGIFRAVSAGEIADAAFRRAAADLLLREGPRQPLRGGEPHVSRQPRPHRRVAGDRQERPRLSPAALGRGLYRRRPPRDAVAAAVRARCGPCSTAARRRAGMSAPRRRSSTPTMA